MKTIPLLILIKKLLNRFNSELIKLMLITMGVFMASLNPEPLYANPEGGQVIAGSAAITQSGNITTINQTSNKAILNWQSFSIDAGQTTRFNQPSSSAIALNRVTGNDPSKIFGTLSANGQVLLINPNGILFGAGSVVDVAGLIATTAQIKDADFLAAHYHFVQDASKYATVVNEGSIRVADTGLVALVAPGVENRGIIQANLGKVVLASGKEFTVVDTYGDNLLQFATDSKLDKSRVSNSGTIYADGGKVLMTAQAAAGVVDHVINMEGVIQANSVQQRNGEIILAGGAHGVVSVKGKLSAKGSTSNTKGGSIQVSGEKIGIFAGSVIDASGQMGGGSILIGGDYQGENPAVLNATATYVDANATLKANALMQGNGGKIIVWANDTTRVYGNLSAQGGVQSGDGGLIETSSKGYLDVSGILVDTNSTVGQVGEWLLDPADLTICTSCNTTASYGSDVFSPGSGNSYLKVPDLVNRLTNTNITVKTTSAGTGGNGDIFVIGPISWSSGHSLTLNAFNTLNINAAITGNGDLNLIAGNGVNIQAPITLKGSDFNLTSSKGDVNVNANIITAGANGAPGTPGNTGANGDSDGTATAGCDTKCSPTPKNGRDGTNGTSGLVGTKGGNIVFNITNGDLNINPQVILKTSGGEGGVGGDGGSGGNGAVVGGSGGNGGNGGSGGAGGYAGNIEISILNGNLVIQSQQLNADGGKGGNGGSGGNGGTSYRSGEEGTGGLGSSGGNGGQAGKIEIHTVNGSINMQAGQITTSGGGGGSKGITGNGTPPSCDKNCSANGNNGSSISNGTNGNNGIIKLIASSDSLIDASKGNINLSNINLFNTSELNLQAKQITLGNNNLLPVKVTGGAPTITISNQTSMSDPSINPITAAQNLLNNSQYPTLPLTLNLMGGNYTSNIIFTRSFNLAALGEVTVTGISTAANLTATDIIGISGNFEANNNINFGTAVNILDNTNLKSSAGNVNFNGPVNVIKDGASLSINAAQDIIVNQNLSLLNGSLNISAGHDFSLNNNQTINSDNGTISINANNNLTVNGSIINNNTMTLKADADRNGSGDLIFYNTTNLVSNNNPMTWQGARLFIQNGNSFHFDSGSGLFTLIATNIGSANQPSLGLGDGANGYMQISSAFLNNVLYNSGVSFNAVNGINVQNLHLQVVDSIVGTEFPVTFDAGAGKLNFVNSFVNTANNQLTLKASDLNIDSNTTLNSGTADTIIQSTGSIGVGVIGVNAATGQMKVTNQELSTITAENLKFFAGANSDIQVSSMQQPDSINSSIYLTAYSGSIDFNGGTNAAASQFNTLYAQAGHSIAINNSINANNEIRMIANAASDLNSNFQPNGGALTVQAGINLTASHTILLETDGIPNDAVTFPAGALTINGMLNADSIILQGNNLVEVNGLINAASTVNIWANHDGDRTLYFTMGNTATITTGGNGKSGQVLIQVNNTQPSGNGSLGVPIGYATLGNINTQTLRVDTTAGGTATTGAYINQTTGTHLNVTGSASFITGSGSSSRPAYIQLDQAENYFGGPLSLTTGASSNGSNFAKVIYRNNNTLQLGSSNIHGGNLTVISQNSGIALMGAQYSSNNITLAAGAPNINAPNDDPYRNYSFYNSVGANALATPNGRWIVYSTTPDFDYFNQLNSNNLAYWGQIYGAASNASIPGSGNYYAFSVIPYLDVKADHISAIYGDVNAHNLNFLTYTMKANFGYHITSDTQSAFQDNSNQLTALYTGTPALTLVNNPSQLNVGDYKIVASQGSLMSATGYQFNFTDSNLIVSPRPITITANSDQSKVYGDLDPTFGFAITKGSLVDNDQFTGTLVRTAGENVGDYTFNLGSLTVNTPGFAGNNYNVQLSANSPAFTITPRAITISADANQTKVYGSADPIFGYSITQGSLIGTDYFSGQLGRAEGENVGKYSYNLGDLTTHTSGFQGSNYIINLQAASATPFSITPAPLVISANNATRFLWQANPSFTASFNGLVNGDQLTVINNLSLYTIASINSPAGTYAISPIGALASNYNITFLPGELFILPVSTAQLPNILEGYNKNASSFENNKTIVPCIEMIDNNEFNQAFIFNFNQTYSYGCKLQSTKPFSLRR